ncbi:hypothetical protein RJ55_08160 [Drechmeria coniospora]|nr:hypothetical protein RJ55_08160 [Drechmeria coniospora]
MDPESDYCLDEDDSERSDGVAQPDETVLSPRESSKGKFSSLKKPGSDRTVVETDDDKDDDSERVTVKRPANGAPAHRPFKRQRGIVNTDYLDMLNMDIDDAAQRVCLDDEVNLPSAQIGLTRWSSLEKQQLFEAISRLGRHDVSGIANRVRSKSLIEIQQYIGFLHEACNVKRKADRRSILVRAEFPAAVEMSQACCHAQDEIADAISLRQEQRETLREETIWGPNWDVTLAVAAKLSAAEADQPPPFSQLFTLRRWLMLSERIFMNSSIPSSNWNYVDDVRPSVRATAFEDFHSLTVSITRRLVQATLFISMSRIRAKRELVVSTRSVVTRKDVEAAIASLGMSVDSRDWWRKSARRLRLAVCEEPLDRDADADDEPMTYDEVEAALREGEARGVDADPPASTAIPDGGADSVQDSDSDSDGGSNGDSTAEDDEPGKEEEFDIDCEAREILHYAAADLRDVASTRQALRRRIATERQQEEQADQCDRYASYQAETKMWKVLQRNPPAERATVYHARPLKRSILDVESIYPVRNEWTSQVDYCGEWETMDENGRA